MTSVLLVAMLVLALARANGANDVAKGVATLAGSDTSNARHAIFWGSLWTVMGGLAETLWGSALVSTFSVDFLVSGWTSTFTCRL